MAERSSTCSQRLSLFHLLTFLLSLLVSHSITLANAGASENDVRALLDVRAALKEANPAALESWSESTDPCGGSWEGSFRCDDNGHVTFLSLAQKQLHGPIPGVQLAALTALNYIDLASNSFTGPIPEQLLRLTSLQILSLSFNQLSGTLPAGFSQLQALKQLQVAGNQLSGELPASLSSLSNLTLLDVSYNAGLGGPIPAFFGDFDNLASIVMQFCSFSGPLPPSLGNLVHVQEVLLDNNQLSGPIPDEWGTGLERVEVLHLNDNQLSGTIPGTFCHLEYAKDVNLALNRLQGTIPICLTSLRRISSLVLSFNRLTGPVPPVPAGVQVFFKVNGNCLDGVEDQQSPCPAPDELPPPAPTTPEQPQQEETAPSSSSTWSWMRGFLIALLSATFVLLLIFAFVLLANRSDSHNASRSDNLAVQEYSLGKIKKATRSFTTVYGRGSFGTVYLAEDFLRDQIETRAIIKRAHDPEKLGEYVFKAKADFLARVRHRSLVALLGFCVGKGERILVYEYLPNGSLYDRLHRRRPTPASLPPPALCPYASLACPPGPPAPPAPPALRPPPSALALQALSSVACCPDLEPIPWDTRVRIAANVASALSYLHHCCHPPLVHRAVTSSNILLTFDMSGKLSDFGLARGGSPAVFDDGSKRRRPSKPARTRSGGVAEGEGGEGGEGGEEGQSALQGGELEKVDVYGFGVVLLELITGQKAMKEVHITSLAAPFLEDAQMMPLMVDAALGGFFDQAELIALGTIARDCVKEDPSARPSMRDVVRTMQAQLDLEADLFAAPAGVAGTDDLDRGDGGDGVANSSGYAPVGGKSALASAWVSLENVASSVRTALTSPRVAPPHPASESTADPTDVEMSSLLLIAPRAARR
ncbi:unnamed protein product [Closterium sp. NIES-53]